MTEEERLSRIKFLKENMRYEEHEGKEGATWLQGRIEEEVKRYVVTFPFRFLGFSNVIKDEDSYLDTKKTAMAMGMAYYISREFTEDFYTREKI